MNKFHRWPLALGLLLSGLALADVKGADFSAMDKSVAPGDDFFSYVNGSWVKSVEIPADLSSYGNGVILRELTDQRVAELIRQTTAAPPGSEARKIGDYYASFMDETAIEAKGLKPLEPELKRILSIKTRAQLAQALGQSLHTDVDIFNNTQLHTANLFGLWVAQDLDEPSRYAAFIVQGGLGMPDRDYYLNPSDAMALIRDKYRAHIVAMLKLLGVLEPESRAERIYALEKSMAQVHESRTDSEQVEKGDNHWPRAKFDQDAPGLDWRRFFAAAGLDKQQDFIVWQPAALVGLSKLTLSESIETWKDYLLFHTLEHMAGFLPRRFVDEQFAFYGTTLTGTPQMRPRWKRAVAATNAALGQPVGHLYVQKYFSPEAKARAAQMVSHILAAFAARIDALDWMSAQTKLKAKAKLAALRVEVGYPDHWRSYATLSVIGGDALGNFQRAEAFEYRRNLVKLDRPVDRSEWAMNPQLVNAVNLPAMNALNFPAAILQPPYFDKDRPAAMDYGSIGAIIGHEISHSFDDQGALFDASGRLMNWWQPADFAHFKASGARLAAQYDGYKPFADLAVNGAQTLGENIADVAGLNASLDAYLASRQGAEPISIAGFKDEQLFFLSFAATWRSKSREAALRNQIITDGHSPAQYRADTVRNLDAWYQAFNVIAGQALYLAPQDRVRIW
jgi:putative endopeptidase